MSFPLMRAAAVVAMLIATVLWVGPAAMRVDIFDGDAAHHVWWLYLYADSSLFPGDLMVDYFRTNAPLGYRALYAALAPFIDVLLATELVAAVVYLAGGWLAWRIGKALDLPDRELGGLLAVAAFVLVVSVARHLASGVLPPLAFQRTFSMPLLMLCLWALIARRYVWVGVSWIGAAALYPVLLPVMGLTAACVFARDWLAERRMPDAWVVNGILGVGALALALFGVPTADELGPPYSFEEAVVMPEYGTNGRLELYVRDTFVSDWFSFHMTGLGWPPRFLLLLVPAIAFIWWRGPSRAIPFAAWAMAGAGVALWFVMRLFPAQLMFGLYLPNRHSRWAIAVFSIVVFAAAAALLVDMLLRRRQHSSDAQSPLAGRLLAMAVPIVCAVWLWPYAAAQWRSPVDRDLENVYGYLASLPKDTLVAAHPTLADYVPLRTQRSVLTSTETSMPWLHGYYAIFKPRVEASLRAAYAGDIAELDAEMAPYGVDVFVTGPMVWEQTLYHEPYNQDFFQELLARGRERGFALRSPPADRVLFRSGDYYVLRVTPE